MTEGLGCYIKDSIVDDSLQGLTLHGIRSTASHIQFVDDTMIMGSPTAKEYSKIHSILNNSSEALGTSINVDKYQIFFFKIPMVFQNHVTRLLGLSRRSLPSKYLGIPLTDNTLHNSSYKSLINSLNTHLNSWTFLSLNLARLIVLLKSMLQSILVYLFSALAATKIVLISICNIQRKFLW
jgi:hypothetical protein